MTWEGVKVGWGGGVLNENHMEGGEKEGEGGEEGSSCGKHLRLQDQKQQLPSPPSMSQSIKRKNSSRQLLENLIR